MIIFGFCPDIVSGDDLRLQKFRNLDIFELFKGHISINYEYDYKMYEYAIDFGNDAEGAARLISKVLHEVNGFDYGRHLDYYTNMGADIEKCRTQLNGGNTNLQNAEEENTPFYKQWWFWSIIIGVLLFCFFISD